MPRSPRTPGRRRRAGAVLALLASVTGLVACGSDSADGDPITFAAVPSESAQSIDLTFDPLVQLIGEATGRPVRIERATDYAAVIEGQRAGHIDIASYGPLSYTIARGSGVPVEAVAAPVDEEGTQPAYTSLAYVRADSGIGDLADVRRRTVCAVDAASTSGYLVPAKAVADTGADLETDARVVFAGGHDAALLALADGQCDIAFAHDSMLTTLASTGQVDPVELRPIWESGPIPEDPIAVNTDSLDPETVRVITEALRERANKPALVEAGICSSEEECVLPEETGWGYVAVDDGDYGIIRDMCADAEAAACRSVA